ncbi:MAG: spore coat protein U domain-containing protein [Polaromonas sp.]|nr:spore coat protein U domain-containing protein [Polaromonas sp.]
MKSNDAFRLLLKVIACFALMVGGSAQAAINCNLTSNGFSSFYDPANLTQNITSASFTMTCTRSALGDATSQSYTVMLTSGTNQASLGNNRINYDVFIDSACGTPWRGVTTLGGTITFASSTDYFPHSQTVPYWGCVPKSQTVAAGTYTDTVTMNPSIGSNATFPVTIVTPSSCSISTPPGNVTFNYTSFQGYPASASPPSPFAATCTNQMPYTMALDATSGTLLGLNYTLSLSASSATGTGLAQSYSINGSIAAGQAGTCAGASCTATAPRTLTISY